MTRARGILLAVVCLLFSVPTFAQFNASIQGTVTDPTGAVVPGATVTATNDATGVASQAVTTGAGVYRISGLPPGTYTVTTSAASFKDHTDKNVVVAAETPRGLNVQLIAGAATETVTVSAETNPALQTENANVAGTISTQQVEQLPSFGRDPYELLRLAPGVFGNGARAANGTGGFLPNNVGVGSSANSLYQVENQPQISANGQRVTENNFTIDGVDVNSLTHGGAAVVTPTEESVQEIKVLSSTYEAEDGRNSGAQVKVISKTGTNSLHGSGFFKDDEPGLNAFNRYDGPPLAAGAQPVKCTDGLTTFTSGGSQCPVRVDNKLRNYGGSIGGPIVKDKLFFFFAYEGEHRKNINYGTNYVYTPQFASLVKQVAPNSIAAKLLAQPGITPRIVAVLNPSCGDLNVNATQCAVVNGGLDIGSPDTAGSAPGNPYLPITGPTSGGVGGALIGSGLDGIPDLELAEMAYPNPGTGNQFNARVDYNLSSKHTIAASTYLTYANSTNPPGTDQTSAPSRDVINKPFSPAGTVLWNWIVSPTMLNEVRLNFSHFGFNEINSNPNANYGIPDVEIQDLLKNGRRIWFGVPQGPNTPGLISQNTYGLSDVLTKTLSKHNFKFGFEYRKEQNNNNQVGFARPLYTISHLWNFVNDAPIFEQNEVNPATGNPNASFRHFRTSYYGGFAQDDFKLSPTLTLNLGLRYEYYTPVSETHNLLSNIVLASNTSQAYANATLIQGNTVYSTDKRNFAPRFGFAWSPQAYSQRVVFRGGFGMYYDYIPEATFDPARDNPPFSSLQTNCCGTAGAPFDVFGMPFDGGKILYSLGANNSPTSYPGNPLLGGGINPATGFPVNGTVQVYFEPRNIQIPYVYGYSLETEMQMPEQIVVTLGYQGSMSKHLLRIFDANQVFDLPPTNVNPGFYIKNDVNANFNSLNVRVVRNFVNNFQVALKYRWAKSMDEASFGEGANASANETFPRNLATEYGPSDFDATNFLVLSAVARSPYLGGRSSLLGKIVGGWELSPIYTYQTGFPWTPLSNNCINTPAMIGICPIRPIAYFGGAGTDTSNSALINGTNFPGGGKAFFNPGPNNCTPLICAPGVGRNSFRGPGYHQLDMSFGKQFPVSFVRENAFIEVRANAFNVLNHLNLSPYTFNTGSTIIQDPHFGTPGTTNALAGRVIELQARFQF